MSSSAVATLPDSLNLGCGNDQRSDWHNVDVSDDVDPDEQVDLAEMPWPWPDDAFNRVEARHLLEHLDPVPWEEIARVLAPGGHFTWVYPIGHTRFEDATHKQFWNYHTAEQVAGGRKHGHEALLPLRFVDQTCEWEISQPEPLVRLYTQYRLWVSGPGPWLEQIPGVFGEVTAVYRNDR